MTHLSALPKVFPYLISALLLAGLGQHARAQNSNAILTRTYKTAAATDNPLTLSFPATTSQATTRITYFDGLGKPTQQVRAFQAASKADIILLTEYDSQFRPFRTYLPAPLTTNGGASQQPATIKLTAANYYKNPAKVTAPLPGGAPPEALATQTTYETAPLSRPTQQQAPATNTPATLTYGINAAGEVKRYQTTGTGLTQIELHPNQTFGPGELSFRRTTDENLVTTTEFTDREGRTLLKRQTTDEGNLDTYFVYDELQQLRAVLQPNFQQPPGNTLQQNAFLYRYDQQGRLIEKKVPAANAVQMFYKGDTDLLGFLTDGNGNGFSYTYDNLNRQTVMNVNGNNVLYTYYDDYTRFTPFQNYTNELGLGPNEFADNPQTDRKGLVTGTSARVLLPNGAYGGWLETVIYYDNKYRPIQTVRRLYGLSSGAYERVSYQLAFDGKPQREFTTQVTGSGTFQLRKAYRYDHADRLVQTDHEFLENGVSKKQYTHNQILYNELGQPAVKSLHGGMHLLASKYNPRGWLGNLQTNSGPLFLLGLTYLENGNITAQSWSTPGYSGRMDLAYDKASRLRAATATGSTSYSEAPIRYDANGNITNLTRTYNNVTIDELAYQYHGNQLHRVNDGQDNQNQAVKDFLNGASADDELSYDANGNLTKDDNRGIGSVAYNVLNLPRSLSRYGRVVSYTYDGAGNKLRSEAPDGANTCYAGAFEYRADNSLLRIGLEEGQLIRQGSDYVVQYYLRDHLGNVRTVLDESGVVVQETDYYAFGLPIQRSGTDKNKYLYNGKEKQPETDWLDYGARMYDPTVGRMNQVDALAEAFTHVSPFSYGLNNPVFNIDPTGDSTVPYKNLNMSKSTFNVNQDAVGLDAVNVTAKRLSSNSSGDGGVYNDIGQHITQNGSQYFDLNGPTGGFMLDNRAEDDPTRIIDALIAFIPNRVFGALGLLSRINVGSKVGAASSGLKYAFGFRDEAIRLSSQVGAKHLMKDPHWKDSFLKVINNPKSEIHFSLNGIDDLPMNMINSPVRSSTNWEMHQLYQSPAFERTIFHHGGNTFVGFDVFKIKP